MASKGRRKRIAFSDAVRSRRALRTLWHNACISYRRYEKSVNVSFYIFFELMTASKGRRKRIAFSDAVRSRRALRTLWHNACISYRRYEKSVNVSFYIFFELMTASKGDESTKYSQSPCDDDERSARLKTALLYLCYTKI